MSLEVQLGRMGVFSTGIARIPHLAALTGAERVVFEPGPLRRVDSVVGWGRKPNTARARRYAARHGIPFVALEDGFLRSVGLGVTGEPPLSIVRDPLGIYYDATRPSWLETELASDRVISPEILERAERCIRAIREAKLSKYNHAPNAPLPPSKRPRVLVVDQTAGDLSLSLGKAPPDGFARMLAAAEREHPDAEIILKAHPDVLSGQKHGSLTALAARDRLRILDRPINPAALLDEVSHVYVMTSLLGFEALLAGCSVACFGTPFYAGWGLTDDRRPIPERRGRARSAAEIFALAYLEYARYVDPETGDRCEAERIIEHLALQRTAGARNPRTVVAVGFSVWKRGFVGSFVSGPGTRVVFAKDADDAGARLAGTDDAAILSWGVKEGAALRQLAESRSVPLHRMEDGFLRSVGLGSDLYMPASLVVDSLGIYYDPTQPSELERILATGRFEEDELLRAQRLRERIVAARVSKYNVGVARKLEPEGGRDVVLVVGQVEGDASIARGTLDVRTDEALLRAARIARPHAYLAYKPHPDVLRGNRASSLPLEVARRIADEIITDTALADCLDAAEEVHTMTSLVGFEALLRMRKVVCYGQPFYAGWGLTEDRHPHPRRTRRLTLDELVAGVLLRYPRYVSPVTLRYTTPEHIVAHLERAKRDASRTSFAARPTRYLVQLENLARGIVRAARTA